VQTSAGKQRKAVVSALLPLKLPLRSGRRRWSRLAGGAGERLQQLPDRRDLRSALPSYSIAAGKVNYRKQVASVFLPDDAQNARDAVTYAPALINQQMHAFGLKVHPRVLSPEEISARAADPSYRYQTADTTEPNTRTSAHLVTLSSTARRILGRARSVSHTRVRIPTAVRTSLSARGPPGCNVFVMRRLWSQEDALSHRFCDAGCPAFRVIRRA
jgi:hypothetical protein